jgi:2-phosphoxylose phosphatase
MKSFLFGVLPTAQLAAAAVDLSWHAPKSTDLNNIDTAINGQGTYGFIFNTSKTPDEKYGTYNWCNMPHVRAREYKKASSEYKLQYVEVIHRHHKRTPYASNAFPVEPYQWNCDDQGLYYYGQPLPLGQGKRESAETYWAGVIPGSGINPFVPSGWLGTCQFPQITEQGLDDSWDHGYDLYSIYHDLLNFIPGKSQNWREKVKFRVTNNQITSQVAGMLISGMFSTTDSVPLTIQASGIDSLEPQYSCSAGSNLFNNIRSGNNAPWANHLMAARNLFAQLDDISGVPPSDSGFHASFDHYYDNLSARQCHNKPLPCKLVNGVNSTTCVSQEQANAVYRIGQWEYSQIYRDAQDSLKASLSTYGVWVAELASHFRAVVKGESKTLYFHNIAHDGSVSRLLSILQLDEMVWPGMGSEIVFELYKKTGSSPASSTSSLASSVSSQYGNPIKCRSAASTFATLTARNATSVPSSTTATATTAAPTATATSASGNYVRVLFNGQTFKSSNPSLGLMDMLPVETLLEYFDGLVGENASLVRGKCSGSIPL